MTKSAKGVQRVEICDDVIKLGEDGSTNDANEEKSDVALSEEDSTNEIGELPKSNHRNAMGEYIPDEGENPLTQQAVSGPGPSSYTPVIDLTKPSAAHYSIVGKPKDRKEDYIPGPNQYDTGTSMTWNRKTRTLKAKLETSPYRPNARDHLTCSLGSAAYKVEYHDTGKHVPRYTMGLRYDDRTILGPPNIAVEPVDTKGFVAPGPNYSPHDGRGMEKSFGLKHDEVLPKDGPGPAEYTPTNRDRGRRYSLGHRVNEPSAFDVPGPGAYEVKSTIGCGFGASIRGRRPLPSQYSVPSPNTYVLPDAFQDAPLHSMTYRTFETEVCETPGPANYRQNCRNVCRSPAAYSCRQQCRPGFPAILNYPEYGLMKNEDVGPETYDADKGFDKNNSPAYSIGTGWPKQERKYPGPAHYHISLPCRPNSFKAPEFSIGKVLQKGKGTVGPGPAAYRPQNKNRTGPAYSMSSRSKQKKGETNCSPIKKVIFSHVKIKII